MSQKLQHMAQPGEGTFGAKPFFIKLRLHGAHSFLEPVVFFARGLLSFWSAWTMERVAALGVSRRRSTTARQKTLDEQKQPRPSARRRARPPRSQPQKPQRAP